MSAWCSPPLRRRRDAHGTADSGAAQPAIAAGVLGEVLLVVGLGVIERAGLRDLGRDLAVASAAQHGLVSGPRLVGGRALGLVAPEDRRAVLRADVVALAHPLGGVVSLPEQLQHLLVAGGGAVERDKNGLGMAGAPAADLLVGGVRGKPAGVADGRRVDAVGLPEEALRAPEAAHPERRHNNA